MSKEKQNDCNYVTIEDVLDIDKAKSIGQMIAEEVDKQISKDIAEVLKKRLPTFYKVDEEKVMHFAKAFLKAQNGNPDKSEVEELEKEVERLTTIINSYALQYGTVADKQKVIDKAKSEVAREIEKFEQQVGKIYNRYVFEDTDYADDDVAIEAVINALTDVLNDLADFKKKYTEGKG